MINKPKLLLTSTRNFNSVIIGDIELYVVNKPYSLELYTSIYDTISRDITFSVRRDI
jgi:hypothetical protein